MTLRDGRLHRLGDLVVAQRVDLAQQQRRALGLGQVLHVRDEQPELLALWTLSAVDAPPSDRWTSIESTPTAWARRRWLSDRLRAIRYSQAAR